LFAKSPAPSNLRDGALASNPDIPLEYLRFLLGPDRIKLSQKLHFGAIHSRSPNDNGNRADAAEPKGGEPQQALRQRSCFWRRRHQ
jgi:hypothetical protein